MKTTRRKKQQSPAQNVEVYNHVDNEFDKTNELTISEQIFAWTVASLIVTLVIYAIL